MTNPLPTSPDVLVVGAGAAGIAAARGMLAAGLSVLVLEARDRAGGRALTDRDTLGAPFDLGATWLHAAEANPLTPIARVRGFATCASGEGGVHRVHLGDRWATDAERAEHDAAHEAWTEAVLAAAEARERDGGPDVSVAEAAPRGVGRWAASAAAWECELICGAEPEAMGLADFAANQLEGSNLRVERGLGTFVAALAEGVPAAFGRPVERLRLLAGGRRVRAEGAWGTVEAGAVVVTVPTGVLAAGGIAFDPPLPARAAEAIQGLPMGLLSKVGLRAAGSDRLDLPPGSGAERAVERTGEPRMSFVLWPLGRPYVEGFVGGDAAWSLARERDPEAAHVAFALDEAARLWGGRARMALRAEGAAVVSSWGTDPFARGGYSYARPGAAPARRVLAEPLWDGRLRFAGEHVHATLSGTVGGAWETGRAAAAGVAALVAEGARARRTVTIPARGVPSAAPAS